MIIRKAEAGEEQDVFSFYKYVLEKRTDQDYRLWWNLDVYPTFEDFRRAVQSGTMHIAVEEGKIIGAAILNGDQMEGYGQTDWACNPELDQIAVIHLVAVDPEQRGQGLGRALMNHLISTARDQGIKSLRLDTMPHYVSAIHLYEKCGFVKRNEIDLWYPTTGKMTFCLYELVL